MYLEYKSPLCAVRLTDAARATFWLAAPFAEIAGVSEKTILSSILSPSGDEFNHSVYYLGQ